MWSYGRHENLIGLVGICATHKPYWLVMEYCAQERLNKFCTSLVYYLNFVNQNQGSLRDFLIRKRISGDIEITNAEGTEADYDRQLSLVSPSQ